MKVNRKYFVFFLVMALVSLLVPQVSQAERDPNALQSLSIERDTVNLSIGQTITIRAKATTNSMEEFYVPDPNFVSSNPEVLSVTPDGILTAISEGQTVITVTYGGRTWSDNFYAHPPRIQFDHYDSEYPMVQGETISFTLTELVGNFDCTSNATYTSSAPDVVQVSNNGTFTALKPGYATITATYAGASNTANVAVVGSRSAITAGIDDAQVISQRNSGYAYLNSVRTAMGFGTLTENPLLTKAAQAHANYLGSFSSEEASNKMHYEEPGDPGYTGKMPSDRIGFQGLSYPEITGTGEDIAFGYRDNTNNQAVQQLLDAPYHRSNLLDPTYTDIGTGISTTSTHVFVTDLAGRSNTPYASTPFYYPYAGQSDIPTFWYANESPNPLSQFGMDGALVGYPITISLSSGNPNALFGSATIKDSSGNIVDYYNPDPIDPIIILIPKSPLKPLTTYTVDVKGSINGIILDKTWSFTTNNQIAPSDNVPTQQDRTGAPKPTTPEVNQFRTSPVKLDIPSNYLEITDQMKDLTGKGHWASKEIAWAISQNITQGYPDHTFRPDQPVTEAEFLAFLFRALKSDTTGLDLQQYNHWADGLYAIAARYQLPAPGYYDVKARDIKLTRTRVAEIITAVDRKPYTGDQAIEYLLSKGYSAGKTAPTVEGYHGNDTLTRAEAVKFLWTIMNKGVIELK